MREIVLDTETTGLDPFSGHRLVEIACLELVNCIPTGAFFHTYLNPDRDVPTEAAKIHGLTHEFLKDFPCFNKVYEEFLCFVRDSSLVIHNAAFDLKFLNFELDKVSVSPLVNPVIDTLKLARERFPGSPASLDALCRRFKVDLSNRSFHGALVDCELLASVYLEMKGGRQQGLGLSAEKKEISFEQGTVSSLSLLDHYQGRIFREPRIFPLSQTEKERHISFVHTKL